MDNPARHPDSASPRARSAWPFGRLWAIALVTLRQGLRMRLWLLAPVAVVILVAADLSSPRYDPVFDSVPAAISTSILIMTVLAVVIGIFFATYSLPSEIETKVTFSVVTKPVSRTEIVAGKVAGMSLLVLAILAPVAVGAYGYILIRSSSIQSLAAKRMEESRARVAYPADLNALQAVARHGPLQTFGYHQADANPVIEIAYGDRKPDKPGFLWVLGETDMHITWDLSGTPLREWSAAGPCQLRIAVDARPPPDAPDATTQVQVAFVSASGESLGEVGRTNTPPLPVYRAVLDVSAAGEVSVPVAGPAIKPERGILNVPPEGDFLLEVMAVPAGHLVGAGPAAVRIVGPGGQELPVKAPPLVSPMAQKRKITVVGRAKPPRQMAVFRFGNVPAGILPQGDVPLEASFGVDAFSSALVPTTAEVTLIKPDTGDRKTILFSPENRHSTLLYIDEAFWHGGPLEIQVQCLTNEDFLFLMPESLRLRLGGGPFAWNLAKATLGVWLFGTALAAIGVFMSTRLSWFVGILAASVFFLLCNSVGFMAQSAGKIGSMEWRRSANYVAQHAPALHSLLPGDGINLGQSLPLAELATSAGWTLAIVVVAVALGAIIFKHREVAA